MQYLIGCFVFLICCLFGEQHVYLTTPNLSKENMIGTNVGIRPFRKSGVRIEAVQLQDKLIVHNYGYGGSGLTLCFGGSKEVSDILKSHSLLPKKAAVLGAGIAGLATAYDLLLQGYQVTIYADAWSPNLTSNVAAGIWSPLFLSDDSPCFKKPMPFVLTKSIVSFSDMFLTESKKSFLDLQ